MTIECGKTRLTSFATFFYAATESGGKPKEVTRLSTDDLSMGFSTNLNYASLLICRHKLDFKFAALFLWIMLVFANLSSIF